MKKVIEILWILFIFIIFNDGTSMTCKDCKIISHNQYLELRFTDKDLKNSFLNIPWSSIKMYTNDLSVASYMAATNEIIQDDFLIQKNGDDEKDGDK